MVKVKEDLAGRRFGSWTVLEQDEDLIYGNKHKAAWRCKCDCGNIQKVGDQALKQGRSTSCGCNQRKAVRKTGLQNKKYNKYDLSGEYGIGYTSKGEHFYFDLEDYDKIKEYCWHIKSDGYVATNSLIKNTGRKRFTILMSKLIVGLDTNELFVDHINHNRFDNRKINLRIVTKSQNRMNHALPSNNTSGESGVSWDEKSQKWHSRIGYNNQEITLGFYNDFNEAVDARKKAEDKYFGEYSYDNSINRGEQYE